MSDELRQAHHIHSVYGVPYTELGKLLGKPHLGVSIWKAGYRAEKHGRQKLSAAQLEAIRKAYMSGAEQSDLAAIAGVHQSLISYHVKGLRGRVLTPTQRKAIAEALGKGI